MSLAAVSQNVFPHIWFSSVATPTECAPSSPQGELPVVVAVVVVVVVTAVVVPFS